MESYRRVETIKYQGKTNRKKKKESEPIECTKKTKTKKNQPTVLNLMYSS